MHGQAQVGRIVDRSQVFVNADFADAGPGTWLRRITFSHFRGQCDGGAAGDFRAFVVKSGQLPGRWQPLRLLRVFPRGLRNWAYDRIALNRYRLFGKYDSCLLPNPDHEQRFLKMPAPSVAGSES